MNIPRSSAIGAALFAMALMTACSSTATSNSGDAASVAATSGQQTSPVLYNEECEQRDDRIAFAAFGFVVLDSAIETLEYQLNWDPDNREFFMPGGLSEERRFFTPQERTQIRASYDAAIADAEERSVEFFPKQGWVVAYGNFASPSFCYAVYSKDGPPSFAVHEQWTVPA